MDKFQINNDHDASKINRREETKKRVLITEVMETEEETMITTGPVVEEVMEGTEERDYREYGRRNKEYMEEIRWQDEEEKNREEELGKKEKVCGICLNAFAKYQCPKCSLNYCGLDCYRRKEHSQCSEGFYQKEVQQHLKTLPTEEVNKRKNDMLKTLKTHRNQLEGIETEVNESESEENSEDELLELLEDLDLDKLSPTEIWNILTPKLKKQFETLVTNSNSNLTPDDNLQSAKLSSILPIKLPWWQPLTTDHTQDQDQDQGREDPPPHIDIPTVPLPPTVHPAVSVSLLSILFSYCLTYRILAGDLSPSTHYNSHSHSRQHRPDTLAPGMILELAPALYPPTHSHHRQFTTLEECFFSTLQSRPQLPELLTQPQAAFLLGWQDVLHLITPSSPPSPLIQELDTPLPPSTPTDPIRLLLGQLYSLFSPSSDHPSHRRKLHSFVNKKLAFLHTYHQLHPINPTTPLRLKLLIEGVHL